MSAPQTPLMQQYREIKAQHQDALLFFRMGDFYELFEKDAEIASRVLGLTLTSRNNGGAAEVPLAGVPVKALNEYLRRLVQQGFRVAICEQVEDPKVAKGIVRRAVVETVTPGAAFSDDLLDGARNNFLCAVLALDGLVGIAAADVSTGELRLVIAPPADLDAALARLVPREIIVTRASTTPLPGWSTPRGEGPLVTERDAWEFDPALARDDLARQWGVHSLEGLGLSSADAVVIGAAGALMRYLHELQPGGIPHLAHPVIERPGGVMPQDEMPRRNLELVDSLRSCETEGTLLAALDRTLTPMGSRLLRQWILAPLSNRAAIDVRLDGVSALVGDAVARDALRGALDGVRDIERLASKAAAGRATPRELRALGDSIARLPAVEQAARRAAVSAESRAERAGALEAIARTWDGCIHVGGRIATALVERPPNAIGDEPTIVPGMDAGLDALRTLRDGGKDAIARVQSEERERTGITSLKVGFNRVFGYYIEITNAHRGAVPADYQRRQTLTGAERYVTPALKEYEERVLTAAERIESRERELFEALRAAVGAEIARLRCMAQRLAELDVLATLADTAEREGYTRPELVDGFDLEIISGRHPVVERMMPREKFIPNDVRLTADARVIILTGPNMAGKSTILRQIGLITLMAQMGSYVPAQRARIGVVDRVFTRVGASDNLVRGQSTFMVEMAETSAILHTATERSLVLLDEIGRGTSTYDGVSIAWSVSEHLHDVVQCKTVFATHYHELTQLAAELPALRNFNVSVREVGDRILFLHRLQPGGADRSYGIEVGRLAGLPAPVLERAKAVLRLLEGEGEQMVPALSRASGGAAQQLPLFDLPHPLVERLRAMDVNAMTPVQAIALLAALVAEAREERLS